MSLATNSTTGQKSHAFELFRFIAVSSVVIMHFFADQADTPDLIKKTSLLFSPFGIPVFFIISGYLLAASYNSAIKKLGNKIKAGRYFLIRRFFRIYPAYVVSLFVLIAFESNTRFEDLLYHLANIHNFHDDYSRSINPVYWSLAVEFQWYLIAPFIIYFVIKRSIFVNLVVLFTLMAISLWARLDVVEAHIAAEISNARLFRLGQDQLHLHLFNFMIGILLFKYRQSTVRIPNIFTLLLFFLTMLCGWHISNVVPYIHNQDRLMSTLAIVAFYIAPLCLGFLMYVLLNIRFDKISYAVISYVSTVSYSLYIYHFPILAVFQNTQTGWYIDLPLYLALSLIISTISYILVEKPFLNWSLARFHHKNDVSLHSQTPT